MCQCQTNLQVATQQSDTSKMAQLRDEMQVLSQQQAKLHFAMDDLLTKERKVEAGSKILKTVQIPTMHNFNSCANPNNYNTEIKPQSSFTIQGEYLNQQQSLSPQCYTQATMVVPQFSPPVSMSSPQDNTQAIVVPPQDGTQTQQQMNLSPCNNNNMPYENGVYVNM